MTPQRVQLMQTLADVDAQLAAAIDAQKQHLGRHHSDPWLVVDPNARPILLDALAARGQVLAALAALVAQS